MVEQSPKQRRRVTSRPWLSSWGVRVLRAFHSSLLPEPHSSSLPPILLARHSLTLHLGARRIIFEDADLDIAVPATSFSISWNSGQICMGSSFLPRRSLSSFSSFLFHEPPPSPTSFLSLMPPLSPRAFRRAHSQLPPLRPLLHLSRLPLQIPRRLQHLQARRSSLSLDHSRSTSRRRARQSGSRVH